LTIVDATLHCAEMYLSGIKIRSSSASTWLYIVVTKVWKWRDQSCYSKHAYLIRIFLIISSSSFLKKR